ncbi:MAG: Gfo/Idh/MocA family oxidoreductase [Anaerolineae bacterium]
MMDKLTVGVIGCGGMAQNHVRGYLNCGRYEIVALSDLDEEAMIEYEKTFDISVRHYTDARRMLDEEDLDVVSIGVWHTGHATWTVAAAARQPEAILCEKPMADTLQRAEQMMTACQRNDVKLAIGHQRRFLPSYTLARELIAEGAVGEVYLMQSFGAQGLPNYCSHQTDMFRYFLDDDCKWVMGNVERKTDRYERETRIADGAVAVFGFACRAQALILCDVTSTVYQGARIYGSEGMIDVDTRELRLMNASTGGEWQVHRPDGKFFKVEEEGRRFEWLEAPTAQADELADWVEGKVETHRGSAEHGFKALEMIHAVYESARCHEKVVLPLQTRLNPLDLMVESGHLKPERPGRYDIRAFLLRGERLWSDEETGPSLGSDGE